MLGEPHEAYSSCLTGPDTQRPCLSLTVPIDSALIGRVRDPKPGSEPQRLGGFRNHQHPTKLATDPAIARAVRGPRALSNPQYKNSCCLRRAWSSGYDGGNERRTATRFVMAVKQNESSRPTAKGKAKVLRKLSYL